MNGQCRHHNLKLVLHKPLRFHRVDSYPKLKILLPGLLPFGFLPNADEDKT